MEFKTKQVFFISIAAYLALFYNQLMGVNAALFAILLLGMSLWQNRNQKWATGYILMVICGFMCALSFAYFADTLSWFMMYFSVAVVALYRFEPKTQLLSAWIAVLAAHVMLPFSLLMDAKNQTKGTQSDSHLWWKKLGAYVIIPGVLVLGFGWLYSFASENFYSIFEKLFAEIELSEFLWMAFLGLMVSYLFWYFTFPKWFQYTDFLVNSGLNSKKYTFQPSQLIALRSGEISLFLLNVLLLVFIGVFGYENFYELDANQLSEDTHARINVVIISILVAIALILFYFQGVFNFHPKRKKLISLSYAWILLNGLLVLTAIIKNLQYISYYGLTFKRLGVIAFALLCWVGLWFTFQKIRKQKSNAYLFTKMSWALYFTFVLVATINWSAIVTRYNIQNQKGDWAYMNDLPYNKHILIEVYDQKPQHKARANALKSKFQQIQSQKYFIFSQTLYWEYAYPTKE